MNTITVTVNRPYLVQNGTPLAHQDIVTDTQGGSPTHAFAVLYLALDEFNPLSDAHGQVASDELLGIVAARLSEVVPAKHCVCRQEHAQFACLLDVVPSRDQLSHLACLLFDAVAAPCEIGSVKLKVRPSIGIAMCPADGETTEALIRSADAAMHCARRNQTGYAFFDEVGEAWAQRNQYA